MRGEGAIATLTEPEMLFRLSRCRNVLRSYEPAEWPWVVASMLAGKVAGAVLPGGHRRLSSYLESWRVLAAASSRGIRVEREGRFSRLGDVDHEIGRYETELRRGSSDFAVFRQCLIERQYGPLVRLSRLCLGADVGMTIIDAGANIGLAALHLSRAFPRARVICLEADRDNAARCQRHVELNALNVEVRHQALWSTDTRLVLDDSLGDGREWARSVRESSDHPNAPTVQGVSMGSLLSALEVGTVDILKVDIEGAEKAVFADETRVRPWLRVVRVLAVEIHDVEGESLIVPLLERHGFLVLRVGETTLAVRRELVSPEVVPSLLAVTLAESEHARAGATAAG